MRRSNSSSRARSSVASASDMMRIGNTQPFSRYCSIWGGVRHFVIDFRNSSGQEANRMRIGGRHALRDVVDWTLTEQLCVPFQRDVALAP